MPDDSAHPQAELAMSLLEAHIQHHDKAADTFDGVARWWLGSEWQAIAPEALQIALRCLYPRPVRQASALHSASIRFAVTRDTLAVLLTVPLTGS